MSRKEYMRKYRAEKKGVTSFTVTDLEPVKSVTGVTWHPEISEDMFKGIGRGIPINGYVLISKKSEPNGNTEHGVVTEEDWRNRLEKRCSHGLMGWSCKVCLA